MDDYVINPLFTQGEVQQLRKFLSDSIHDLERYAELEKAEAQRWSHMKHYADPCWKSHSTIRAKIKKLAALQVKLKSQDVLY